MKKLFTVATAMWLALVSLQAYGRNPASIVGGGSDRGADCLQYLPMVFPEVMKVAGADTRSGWGRLLVSQGFSVALMATSVYTLKQCVSSRRPDRADYDSFPSGHSAWAFAGATVVAKELGWRSPWYAAGAYAFATGIAIERVADRHHSALDVASGAAIGVAMTELGYLLADRIYRGRGLGDKYQLHISPAAIASPDPAVNSLAPGIMVSCRF